MMDLSFLEPVYELVRDEEVRSKLEETGRIFFANSNLTINLIPALIIGLFGLLFLLPLLGIPILDILGDGMGAALGGSSYGAPDAGYGAPSTGYGYVARGDTTYYDQTIADLQSQVESLQASEANLRNSLYYSNPAGEAAQTTNNVAYTS